MLFTRDARFTDAASAVARALPALQPLRGKILVIKLGGKALENQRMILQDVLWLRPFGVYPVLVHGGASTMNAWLEKMQVPLVLKNGRRVIDATPLEMVRIVLCGQINQGLVSVVAQLGGKAVGLSGTDGTMIQAHVADPALSCVGTIDAVNPEVVQALVAKEYLPIIAPLGQGPDGSSVNLNADLVAAHLAGALKAEKLIVLSDVAGICRADGSLISELDEAGVHQLLDEGVISDGMVPKVLACLRAARTIPRVQLLDSRVPHVLLSALFIGYQEGTEIVGGNGTPARSST